MPRIALSVRAGKGLACIHFPFPRSSWERGNDWLCPGRGAAFSTLLRGAGTHMRQMRWAPAAHHGTNKKGGPAAALLYHTGSQSMRAVSHGFGAVAPDVDA